VLTALKLKKKFTQKIFFYHTEKNVTSGLDLLLFAKTHITIDNKKQDEKAAWQLEIIWRAMPKLLTEGFPVEFFYISCMQIYTASERKLALLKDEVRNTRKVSPYEITCNKMEQIPPPSFTVNLDEEHSLIPQKVHLEIQRGA